MSYQEGLMRAVRAWLSEVDLAAVPKEQLEISVSIGR